MIRSNTEQRPPAGPLLRPLLLIAAGVLLLALAIVSAWSLRGDDDGTDIEAQPAATPTTAAPATSVADETDPADDEAPAETTTSTSAPAGSIVTGNGAAATAAPDPIVPELTADGRPASFFAITVEGAAVEVDTVSGRILREIAQLDDPTSDVELPQVLVSIWPVAGTDGTVLLSDCCEPAAGNIYRLDADDRIDDPAEVWAGGGWEAVPDARGARVATSAYTSTVRADDGTETALFDTPGVTSFVDWLRDRDGVVFAEPGENSTVIRRFDLDASGSVATAVEFTLPFSGRDLTVRADGNLVLLATEPDGVDRGIVFTPDGDLVTAFDTVAGGQILDYDARGLFVIQLDDDGNASWQGLGQSGTLGSGYLWVQW